jgi:folate-binding protein YgfZ
MGEAISLLEAERAAGAVIRPYGGVELPEKFADPMQEVERVRAAAGLFDLSFRSRLRFTGADRVDFLHNLLSNDVRSLRAGGGCYATILTRESRVVADANVFCGPEAIFLDVDARRKDRARAHLEQFLVADDVEIEDLAAAEATIGVHGPRAADVIRALLGPDAAPEPEFAHRTARLDGAPIRVARVHHTGDSGFDLWLPRGAAAAAWRALREAGAPSGLVPAGMLALDVLRVEAGIPWVGVDVDESHLVLEAGLERGIHFRKGCYLGQEVVERQSARGHVNRKLVGLRLDEPVVPPAGARIRRDDKEVGEVTSAVFSPRAGTAIALGWVRRESMEPGTRLAIAQGSRYLGAEVVALPFHRPAASPG